MIIPSLNCVFWRVLEVCTINKPAGHSGALPPSLGCSPASPRQTAPKLTPNSWHHRTILGICPPLPIHITISLCSLCRLQNITEENEFFMVLHGPGILTGFLVSPDPKLGPKFSRSAWSWGQGRCSLGAVLKASWSSQAGTNGSTLLAYCLVLGVWFCGEGVRGWSSVTLISTQGKCVSVFLLAEETG